METCETCKFSKYLEQTFYCHRHAPHPIIVNHGTYYRPPYRIFPVVKKDDWCGDFVRKIET